MIKLTVHVNGQPVWIKKEAISSVYQVADGTTCVGCYDNNWYVKETPEAILLLIKAA